MKTLTLFVLLCISFCAFAQKSKKKQLPVDTMRSTNMMGVPDRLIEKFRKDYPGAIDVKWLKVENEGYKVIFKDPPNTRQLIMYDKDWRINRKETELDSKQVPDSIINYYKQNYPQESNYKVWLNEDAGGRIYYSDGTEFGIYFDMNGRMIKHVPKQVTR